MYAWLYYHIQALDCKLGCMLQFESTSSTCAEDCVSLFLSLFLSLLCPKVNYFYLRVRTATQLLVNVIIYLVMDVSLVRFNLAVVIV